MKINFSEKSFLPKNQGFRWRSLMKKIGSKKSRGTIPLRTTIPLALLPPSSIIRGVGNY
jgi:hypothetical protein